MNAHDAPDLPVNSPKIVFGLDFKTLGTLATIVAIVAAVALLLFNKSDPSNADNIKTIFAALAALIVYLKTQDTHLTVNSRMTQFMEESRKFEYARGTADATAVGVDKAVGVAERNAAKATEVAKEKQAQS